MAFAPVFGRVFPATFDRRAAVAAAPPASWWEAGGAPTPVAVYQPKGAASLAASYSNLVNSGTYDAAPGDAPTWDTATGWTFSGVNKYLTTGIVPTNDYTVLVRFATFTDAGYIVGSRDYTTGERYIIEQANWGSRFFNGATTTLWDGVYAAAVKALAGHTAYTDGVAVGTSPDTDDAPPYQLYIGAGCVNGSYEEPFGGDIIAVAIWDTSTDHATWIPAVSAAVALI